MKLFNRTWLLGFGLWATFMIGGIEGSARPIAREEYQSDKCLGVGLFLGKARVLSVCVAVVSRSGRRILL